MRVPSFQKSHTNPAFLLAVIGLTVAFSAPEALAGWISGGGGTEKTANNPWFLRSEQSTARPVSYCISADDQYFGNLPTPLSILVSKAIQYWKDEFHRATLFQSAVAIVGTEDFVETSCTEHTDLRFQFGLLDQQQRDYLKSPRQFIGVAVRTSYDRTTLRGKGFIYISPGAGPDRYDGDDLISNAWHAGNGGLLYRVLVHEIGHVLGVPHIESSSLMRENYPRVILNINHFPNYVGIQPLVSFFVPANNYKDEYCYHFGIKQRIAALIAIPEHWQCWKFSVDPTYTSINLEAKVRFEDSTYQPIGSINLSSQRQDVTLTAAVVVNLTEEQRIFPGHGRVVKGTSFVNIDRVGRFSRSDSSQIDIAVQFAPYGPYNDRSWIKFYGVTDDGLTRILNPLVDGSIPMFLPVPEP